MKTVFITDDYRPGAAYTDYCIAYRAANGGSFRRLSLFVFCRRINNGQSVKVSGTMFCAAPNYKTSN